MSDLALSWVAFLLLAPAAGVSSACDTCIEDVVVETLDGEWILGYIYWSPSPFRYLDLHDPADQRRFAQGSEDLPVLRLWEHAISMSKDRFPETLGELPQVPPPSGDGWLQVRREREVALLVGDPLEIDPATVRRIYPRIGSGLTALEITSNQALQLARAQLPFHDDGRGECLGCPMSAEAVTLGLHSGQWLSGLIQWHSATRRLVGSMGPHLGLGFPKPMDGVHPDLALLLWTEGVSAPRRTFRSHGESNTAGFDKRPGFLRLGRAVLLTAAPKAVRLSEIALVLPGPSVPSYPLALERSAAQRLLLEAPTWVMSSNNDPFYLDCFAYGSEVSLSDLAAVCDAEIASDGQFDALPKQPRFSVAQAPFRTWPAGTECPPRYEHEDIFLLYTFAGT